MPGSKTWKQAKTMARVLVDEEYAAEKGLPVNVAKLFHDEDLKEMLFFDEHGELRPDPEDGEG